MKGKFYPIYKLRTVCLSEEYNKGIHFGFISVNSSGLGIGDKMVAFVDLRGQLLLLKQSNKQFLMGKVPSDDSWLFCVDEVRFGDFLFHFGYIVPLLSLSGCRVLADLFNQDYFVWGENKKWGVYKIEEKEPVHVGDSFNVKLNGYNYMPVGLPES